MLEVYNNDEVDDLIKKKQLNDCILPQDKLNVKENEDLFDITDDEEDETINIMINQKLKTTIKTQETQKEENKEEFNWDDI